MECSSKVSKREELIAEEKMSFNNERIKPKQIDSKAKVLLVEYVQSINLDMNRALDSLQEC